MSPTFPGPYQEVHITYDFYVCFSCEFPQSYLQTDFMLDSHTSGVWRSFLHFARGHCARTDLESDCGYPGAIAEDAEKDGRDRAALA